MSEWWTYRPSDFLMFAPDTYWRQFELHNAALWPVPLLPVAMALAWIVWMAAGRRSVPALRLGLAGLALCMAFAGWAFLWQRYAPINWAARWFAAGFGLQALGLLWLAILPGLRTTAGKHRRLLGLALIAWATVAHPLLALAFGRPWVQAELLGAAPDPTAIATLGGLLWADARSRAGVAWLWVLRSLATTWCLLSAATLWTMGSAQGWVLAALAVAALGALWRWPHGQHGRG